MYETIIENMNGKACVKPFKSDESVSARSARATGIKSKNYSENRSVLHSILLCFSLLLFLTSACKGEHFAKIARDAGQYKRFLGNVEIGLVFVSTPDHPWTESAKNEVFSVINSSIDIIESEARRYNVPLTLNCIYFEYYSPYDYSYENWSDLRWFNYGLENYFYQDSFTDLVNFYETADQKNSVPLCFMFNSYSRSFTLQASHNTPWQDELNIYFCDHSLLHNNFLTHEFLHLYGAIDLYDYYPGEGVEAISKQYFSESVMRGDGWRIDELTAYLIGWLDIPTVDSILFMVDTEGMR